MNTDSFVVMGKIGCCRLALVAVLLTSFGGIAKGEDGPPVKVEYRSILDVPLIATSGKEVDFIDKRWVEHTYFLTRNYNKPEKLPDAVLHHENLNYPLAASGTVLRNDDGALGFYYQTTPRHRPWAGIPRDASEGLKKKWAATGGLYKYYLHYATSRNGVNWDIPNLITRTADKAKSQYLYHSCINSSSLCLK